MSDSKKKTFRPHVDFEYLLKLFPAVQEYQALASKHGIDDIFQDNGGKILQLCLCLGISILPGREGNDAVDATTGGEFELKTLNFLTKGGFTTHHHLNPVIIAKYRRVDWIFAGYEGIELRAIWKLTPPQMEYWFTAWEAKWHNTGGRDINNPKIARSYVVQHGELLFPRAGQPAWSQAVRGIKVLAKEGLIDAQAARRTLDVAVTSLPFSGRSRERPSKA